MQSKHNDSLFGFSTQLTLGVLLIGALLLSACTVDVKRLAGTALGDSIFLPIVTNATEHVAADQSAEQGAPEHAATEADTPPDDTGTANEDVSAAFVIGGGGAPRIPVRWYKVTGGLKQVSVGSDGEIWGVNNTDAIWRWTGNGWTPINGALNQIAVGSAGHIWGVNDGNEIFRWNGINWTKESTGFLKQIDVGCDGTVWGVNAANEAWLWDPTLSGIGGWVQMSTGIAHVAVGNANTVWATDPSGNIFRHQGNSWFQVEGQLKQLDIGCDGTIWGVNNAGEVYGWKNNSWTRQEGKLNQISVGSATRIWGINQAGEIVYRQ